MPKSIQRGYDYIDILINRGPSNSVSNHKNVIEINGRVYDVRTGTPVRGQSIDGLVTPKIVKPTVMEPAQIDIKTLPASPVLKPKPARSHTVHHVRHRTPQKSKTLMRRAVKKPTSPQAISVVKPTPRSNHNPSRARRAETIKKSPYISKFGLNDMRSSIEKRQAPLAVKAPPVHRSTRKQESSTKLKQPEQKPAASRNTTEELFHKAMQRTAESAAPRPKTKAKRKSRKGSKLAWSSGVLATLALVGFIAYMNVPNFNMRLASSRAGFEASLPAYQPSGYKINGPVSYKPGQVIISFNSNTDDRAYKLTQEVSNWNSSSLEENFLDANNKQFEIEQDKGKTIYLYDNGNATWVNGGVWYQIESDDLSSDQLVSIASSL